MSAISRKAKRKEEEIKQNVWRIGQDLADFRLPEYLSVEDAQTVK